MSRIINITESNADGSPVNTLYYVDIIPYAYHFKYLNRETLALYVVNSPFSVMTNVSTITGKTW